jgi:transcriptional regulator
MPKVNCEPLQRAAELLELQLILQLDDRGVNQQNIARLIGKSKTHVNRILRIAPRKGE